jgi:hypothetical protein
MPASAFDSVTVTFEVAWTKGVGDTVGGGDWTDESAYVVNFSTKRGKATELDQFQAGTLTVQLQNQSRRFDPDYSAGALFGNLLPGRPCRLRYTRSATTYDVFYGFIESLPQEWDAPNNATATVVAVDALSILARTALPESRYAYEVKADTPVVWWQLGEGAGETAVLDYSGNGRDGAYVGTNSPADSIVTYSGGGSQVLGTATASVVSGAYALSGTDFSIEFWVSSSDAEITSGALAFVQGDTINGPYIEVLIASNYGVSASCVNTISAGTITNGKYVSAGGMSDGRHHVLFTRDNNTFTLYVDGVDSSDLVDTIGGWAGSETAFGSTITLGGVKPPAYQNPDPITLSQVALYSTALSSARALAHYTAGSTAGAGDDVDARISQVLTDAGLTWLSTSLDDSQVTVRGTDYDIGGGTVLGYLQALERTEQGRLFVNAAGALVFLSRYHDLGTSVEIAFTDAQPSTYPYVELGYAFDRSRVYNQAVVSRTNGVAQRYEDATSKTANGPRALTLDALQVQSDAECYDMAVALVSRYKTPAQRYERVVVNLRSAPATLYAALGTLEIGDKVSVRRLPQNVGAATTRTLTVEGIGHTFDKRSSTWTVELLTAAANMPSYLIIGDATYGQVGQEKVGY